MKRWKDDDIEKELKMSKRQNRRDRYDYLCSKFNALVYCIYLEKYTNKLKKEIEKMESKDEKERH